MKVNVFKKKANGQLFKAPVLTYEVASVVEAQEKFNTDPEGKSAYKAKDNFEFVAAEPALV